ncbi:RNA pseudouridylate synthase domain-containing protein 1-like isoform X4 [Sitophilus oryzae]|uniref:RNA pseudouridylate synthase domain-containing protein 1-like isoform X4 n=1 Tax=Sitophilus oryzae TaxID=7048 RepID=A0A6J2X5S6_SITOR|nr:RNA pseudouridylate synthase domain-containing protein 1-like isoform X4 [Sitophilus oryzae]
MFSTFYFIWVILFISQIYFIKKYFKKCDTCQIIHRSDNFLIINKQADIKINSNNKNEETVQTFLRNTCPELTNQKLFHEFYFPHRLDYSTSGILCIPKTREVCKIVSAAFSARTTKKYYVALVRGVLSSNFIDVNISVGDDLREPQIQKMCTSSEKSFCKNPRSARTIVMALEQGHTIIGDYTYSNRKDNKTPRMYLHAIKLVLPNKLEDINVFTDDPFTHIKGWKKLKLFQSLSSGYIEIDRYSNSLNCL